MARVPGVPTLEPVSQPQMSPGEAGRPGEAIANLGAVSNDVAQQGLELDLFLKRAQQNVDEAAFQNQARAAVMQYQEQLAKTTNSRDVENVTKAAHDGLNALTKEWGRSPAAVQIQMQADGLLPEIQHLGVVKTADLQVKESAIQSDIQKQSLLPELVSAQRSGDKAKVDFTNAYFDHIQEEREKAGLISHAQLEEERNAFDIQFRKQLNEAAIVSANPKERVAAINQLTKGGDGPLNLTGLADGDIAALRVHAQSENERLNNLTEAHNMNTALNTVHNAFQAPEFAHNYEARIDALNDDKWLQKNGIVASDGAPDRVMAEKLIAETNRQRAEWEKERSDRDEKVAEKLSPLIDENKMSLGELNSTLDNTPGISPKVRAQLVRQWRENTNENTRLAHESYEIQQRVKAQNSQDVASSFYLRIAQGAVPDPVEIMATPGMSKADKAAVIADAKRATQEKPYQEGLSIIGNAYPTDKKNPAKATLQNEYFTRSVAAYNAEINAHPEEDKSVIAQKIVMPGIVRNAIEDSVRSIIPTQPTMMDRLKLWGRDTLDTMEGKSRPGLDGGTDPAPKATPPSNPRKGDTFNGFTWDGEGWTK